MEEAHKSHSSKRSCLLTARVSVVHEIADFEEHCAIDADAFWSCWLWIRSSGFGGAGFGVLILQVYQRPPCVGKKFFFSFTGWFIASVESTTSVTTKIASKPTVSHSRNHSLAITSQRSHRLHRFVMPFKSTKHSEPPPVPRSTIHPILHWGTLSGRSTSRINQNFQTPRIQSLLAGPYSPNLAVMVHPDPINHKAVLFLHKLRSRKWSICFRCLLPFRASPVLM